MSTDASAIRIGAVLMQKGSCRPIAFRGRAWYEAQNVKTAALALLSTLQLETQYY